MATSRHLSLLLALSKLSSRFTSTGRRDALSAAYQREVDEGGDGEHGKGHVGPEAAAGGGEGVGALVDVEEVVGLGEDAGEDPEEAQQRRERAHGREDEAVDEQHRRPRVPRHRPGIHGPARLPPLTGRLDGPGKGASLAAQAWPCQATRYIGRVYIGRVRPRASPGKRRKD